MDFEENENCSGETGVVKAENSCKPKKKYREKNIIEAAVERGKKENGNFTKSDEKKRDSSSYNENDMIDAIAAVKIEKLSMRKAAKRFNVPYTTLNRKCKKQQHLAVEERDEKRELEGIVIFLSKIGIGYTSYNFFRFLDLLAMEKNIALLNDREEYDWFFKTSKNHPPVTKQTETVLEYRPSLQSYESIDPDLVWAMDTCSFRVHLIPTRYITSDATTQLCIGAVNTSGRILPPYVLQNVNDTKFYKTVYYKPPDIGELLVDENLTREGCVCAWFKWFFLKHIGNTRPQVLTVNDRDVTEILVDIANEENIIIRPADNSFHPFGEIENIYETRGRVNLPSFGKAFKDAWNSGLGRIDWKREFASRILLK